MRKLVYFKKNLVLAFALGCFITTSAQTVIKVGASQPEMQKTIQHAYDSIVPATIEGAYVIELQSDYDPASETYPILIKGKAGANATNNITIKPATGVKKAIGPANETVIFDNVEIQSGLTELVLPSVTGLSVGMSLYGAGLPAFLTNSSYVTVADIDPSSNKITLSSATTGASIAGRKLFIGKIQTQAILFNGAKYVTIDGVSRTGDTGLTIQNPNSIYCQAIMFTGNSDFCTIKNCFIRGANVSGSFNNGIQGTIYMNTASNITITQNDICDMDDPNIPFPITAVQMTGAGSNSRISVTENKLYNISNFHSTNGNAGFFQFGSGGGSDNIVMNNRIYWTKPTMIASLTVIGVGGGMNGLGNRFEGNIMGYDSPDGTGVAMLTSTAGSTLRGTNNLRNFTCKNNVFANIEFTGVNLTGFEFGSSVAQTMNPDDYCSNNLVENIKLNQTANGTLAGFIMNISSPFDVNVKNNIVRNLTIESTTPTHNSIVAGYNISGTGNAQYKYVYSDNRSHDLTAGNSTSTGNNVAYGMRVGLNTSSIDRNLIYNIATVNANATGIVRGLQTAGSNVTGQQITRNIVRIGNYVSSDAVITAFFQEAATTAGDICKAYNNTFYVGGTAPAGATKSTFAFLKNTGNPIKNDFRNNIFANNRTVAGTESHYAYQVNASTDLDKSDYNLFKYGANFAYVTTLQAAAPDLAVWQSLELDINSHVGDPLFENADALVPDMRLKTGSPAINKGTDLTLIVTKDFNNQSWSTFDIGALAFGTISGVDTATPAVRNVWGSRGAIIINDAAGQQAEIFDISGRLIRSISIHSENEIISMNHGFYIVKIHNASSKVLVK